MRRCIIVGKPNVGKTLFLLALAESLRVKNISLLRELPDGKRMAVSYDIREAARHLVDPAPHTTRCLQSVILDLPAGKGRKRVEIIDTTGLSEGVHRDPGVRKSMAQTLAALQSSDLIVHIIDAAAAGRGMDEPPVGEVDQEICNYARLRGGYCIVANKMDIPGADKGLKQLVQTLPPGVRVFPVSALRRRGILEVRTYVGSQL
ncbi:MAG TPA: GTP-binding protein HSR1 [Firmicutes bacterium]|nr:GTP-binding protein HSR1 [Bacillota bacterium]